MMIDYADQPVSAQAREHAIDVRYAQAEGIGHQLLRKRELKGEAASATDKTQAGVQLHQEMRDSLDRRATANVDDVLAVAHGLLNCEPAEG
jgi:hypothetical protein